MTVEYTDAGILLLAGGIVGGAIKPIADFVRNLKPKQEVEVPLVGASLPPEILEVKASHDPNFVFVTYGFPTYQSKAFIPVPEGFSIEDPGAHSDYFLNRKERFV